MGSFTKERKATKLHAKECIHNNDVALIYVNSKMLEDSLE